MVYTVIFAPQPLNEYDFLKTAELRPLSAEEMGRLVTLKQQRTAQGDVEQIDTSATNSWLRNVSLPAQMGGATKAANRLVMFEITLRVQ